ncbi:MAG: ATP synthase F1 subunit epsilon [Butyrivibrio sp.]|nr:ATP synthase F1 subunit epsilon [Butyrivibrio sp.]
MSIDISQTFELKVMSINGIFYDGPVKELIVPCVDGELAILANHEEMILALSDGLIRIIDPENKEVVGAVSVGSLQVHENKCIVIVNTAERPEDIDKRRAQEAYEYEMEQLQRKQSLKEFKQSQAGLARALTRLKAASKYQD